MSGCLLFQGNRRGKGIFKIPRALLPLEIVIFYIYMRCIHKKKTQEKKGVGIYFYDRK